MDIAANPGVDLKDKPSAKDFSEDEQPRYYFGICCWHPKWMQRVFANAKFYAFLVCFFAVLEVSIVGGLTPTAITSLERRYKLSSTASGVIIVAYDIAVLIPIVLISYFGEKRHKPRWLGYGLITMAIGSFIFALPQFVFGKYKPGTTSTFTLESCEVTDEFFGSTCESSTNNLAYFILLVGNMVIGVGASVLYTLGLTFIDDITLPKYVPIYLGIFYVCVGLGPVVGFGLGGAFLTIYVDPWEETLLDETDPAWVGAWWLCYILSGCVCLLLAIPVLMYPRQLTNHAEVVAAHRDTQSTTYVSKLKHEDSFKNQFKALPLHLWELCKNKSYVFLTLAISILFMVAYGIVAFGPKFIEIKFTIPPSIAGILVGTVTVALCAGTIVGALLILCLKSDIKKVAMIPWIANIIIIPVLFGLFISCPTLPISGITTFSNRSDNLPLDTTILSCNRDCACNSSIYEPVCGADGITYFSPCRAGCKKSFDNSTGEPLFSECTCVYESLTDMNFPSTSEALSNSTATLGRCEQDCDYLGPWLLLVCFGLFLVFVMEVPYILITIRSVAEEQRSLALGVQSLAWRVLGTIPGPILFGVIFDSGCAYWQFECGTYGNCWIYNDNLVTTRIFILMTVGCLLSCILNILCWIFYPPVTCKKNVETSSNETSSNEEVVDEKVPKDDDVTFFPESIKEPSNNGI